MTPVNERPQIPTGDRRTIRSITLWSDTLIRQLVAIFQNYGYRLNKVLPKDGTEAMTGNLDLGGFVLENPGVAIAKNALINGDFRINQRGFGGDWSTLSNGDYGYDRWARKDASTISQMVEEGNFKPSTTYTLSGTNVTTQQIVSPASGDWQIDVPNDANEVQLEEGTVATPFEKRPIGTELALCQRYFERFSIGGYAGAITATELMTPRYLFSVLKRVTPSLSFPNPPTLVGGIGTFGTLDGNDIRPDGHRLYDNTGSYNSEENYYIDGIIEADAEFAISL